MATGGENRWAVLLACAALAATSCADDVAGPNRPPVAVAGPDQVAGVGERVLLDGGGSWDPDGDGIAAFRWSLLSAPPGSRAALDPTLAHQPRLELTPDLPGVYLIGLTVDDGELASTRDVARVTAIRPQCAVPGDCPDDGLWCTGTPECTGGRCVETPPDCTDGDACTQDICNEDLDRCDHPTIADPPPEDLATQGSCTDGRDNDCDTLVDDADPGCAACQVAGDCPDDGDVCTGVECTGGACRYPASNEGGACDDGLYCTIDDACAAGVCRGRARDCSALDDHCNLGACDEASDLCARAPRQDGTPCGPTDCNLLEWIAPACEGGACTGTVVVQDCDDGSPCSADSCDPAAGCAHTPANDGLECGARSCDGLRWIRQECQDGLCTGSALLRDCADANPCTSDTCDPLAGCANPDNTDPCDDGDVCTSGDACSDGLCSGAPLDEDGDGYGPLDLGCGPDCDDRAAAINPGVFEGGAGEPPCSDLLDNDCDGDVDEADNTCLPCGTDGDCDDGLYCNGVESCGAGSRCLAGVPPCGIAECNRCDEGDDDCFDPAGTACGSPLRTDCDEPDTCDGLGVCQANPAPADTGCDDDVFCNGVDRCDGLGACARHGGDPCLGGDACNDTCDEFGRTCFSPATRVCDDQDWCNGEDRCNGTGGCSLHGGNPCAAGDECNRVCDGASHSCFAPEGTACGNALDTTCDRPDTCDGQGLCLVNHTPAETLCEDGSFCTGADACDGQGACVGGSDPCLGGPVCQDRCDEAEDTCVVPDGTPCDDGTSCTSQSACAAGSCSGATDLDADGDGYLDAACPGGDDCLDSDPAVNPGASEGPTCGTSGDCFDGLDNDCDGGADGLGANCAAMGFICLWGPGQAIPAGGAGELIVRLPEAGLDPAAIVCWTGVERLAAAEVMLTNDFQSDTDGFNRSSTTFVYRDAAAQNPDTSGGFGMRICAGGSWLATAPLNTVGRTRLLLRYSAQAADMENDENLITEYSPNNGVNWYVLNIQGDQYWASYQRYQHILPPACEGVQQLVLRFRQSAGDGGDCADVDDVAVLDLPEPNARWTVLDNGFEVEEGNSDAGAGQVCDGETIVGFEYQCGDQRKTCLDGTAQRPGGTGTQGARVRNNPPSCLEDLDIDTRAVPPGSDLVAEFYMRSVNMFAANRYSNAWFYDGGWKRLNGVGAATTEAWDWFRCLLEPEALGRTDAGMSFYTPTEASGANNDDRYVQVDDFALTWSRASVDEVGPFVDNGDGTYSAPISSALAGDVEVTCGYFGEEPPVLSDGSGQSSGPAPVSFAGWGARRMLLFRNAGRAEDLVDFPVPVRLDANRIDYTRTQDQGQDLRFVASDGVTTLAHEIETWDEAGTSLVWVRVPRIAAGSNASFVWMLYDNPAAPDSQDPSEVWDPDFVGVWHLAEQGGSTAVDSTGRNPGRYEGGVALGLDGPAGDRAAGFDGVDDLVDLGGVDLTDPLGPSPEAFTLEAVFRKEAGGDGLGRLLSKADGPDLADHLWMLGLSPDSLPGTFELRVQLTVDGTAQERTTTTVGSPVTEGTWVYVAATYRNAAGPPFTLKLFADGALVQQWLLLGSLLNDPAVPAGIAADATAAPAGLTSGRFAEVRLSRVERSPAWLEAQHRAWVDQPGNPFVVFGPLDSDW